MIIRLDENQMNEIIELQKSIKNMPLQPPYR
jgi:hypothetical protein